MNELKQFENAQFGQIRTTVGASNEPLFCLADLCKILDLSNPSMVKTTLKKTGVNTIEVSTPIISQGVDTGKTKTMSLLFIDEPNLYKCIFQSRKKEAEAFQDWVCGEVLPAIRKTGGYVAAGDNESDEEIMARALRVANDTLRRREERLRQLEQDNREQQLVIEQKQGTIDLQQEEIRKSAPKVEYYDQCLQSVNTLTTTQVAKEMGMEAYKLNSELKKCGIVYKQSGQWLLKSPFCNWGLHSTRTQTFTRSDGSIGTSSYTVWTQKGRMFIIRLKEANWDIKKAIKLIKGEDVAA